MANDRIFMVCKKCGKWRTLMKYYPGTGIYLADVDKTGEFLEEHQDCYGFAGDLGDSPPFEFHTEGTFNPMNQSETESPSPPEEGKPSA